MGRAGQLIAFLIESQIPTGKWPSLLGSGGLRGAVVNGKGGQLMAFLIEYRRFRQTSKWPSLLGSGGLRSAVYLYIRTCLVQCLPTYTPTPPPKTTLLLHLSTHIYLHPLRDISTARQVLFHLTDTLRLF